MPLSPIKKPPVATADEGGIDRFDVDRLRRSMGSDGGEGVDGGEDVEGCFDACD